MMHPVTYLLPGLLATAKAQKVGTQIPEIHPKLSWKQCQLGEACTTVEGEIALDSDWRWLHLLDSNTSCYEGNEWNYDDCNEAKKCTENCALEGIKDYTLSNGVTTSEDSISLRLKTVRDNSAVVGSRVYLLESASKYQTFTLMDNELAFDVDLSSVECGIKSSLYFVGMEPDGGMASYPSNHAGAKYGTGYCDASCTREIRFVGGQANINWTPSATDPRGGEGFMGACCPEFDIWNSNAHSYSMSSKPCLENKYVVCDAPTCDQEKVLYPSDDLRCDKWGCDYNPYRLDVTDFYGKLKTVDTTRPFTVVTRFEATKVSQFFIQDGNKIDPPASNYPDFPDSSGLSAEYCTKLPLSFDERDQFSQIGGYSQHNEALNTPMVLTMSISVDHWAHHLWLDSIWTPEREGLPGAKRGDCAPENNDPLIIEDLWPNATVMWSNIRFGPVGSTVDV